MRSPDNIQSISWPLILLVVLFMTQGPLVGLAASSADMLEITTEPAGGVRATARVLFPAKTEVIQGLLADYPHWPELFEMRMRLADWHVRDGVATIDLRLEHALLPGERRLVTESRTLPGGGLVTELKGGDFKQYHRVWTLRPAGGGNETSADFELLFELDSLVPDWIMAMAVRHELETHFRIVKQKAREHSGRVLSR